MPIHDWTRVDAGLFHAFHHDWVSVLSRALNAGVLPPDYFALPDMPIFLKPDFYVPAPLEETYRTTWNEFFPAPMKRLLEERGE